eukprot:COSAG02_NODE_4808_length_4955_cov_3.563633_2_plen_197_part_00
MPLAVVEGTRPAEMLSARHTTVPESLLLLLPVLAGTGLSQKSSEPSPSIRVFSLAFYRRNQTNTHNDEMLRPRLPRGRCGTTHEHSTVVRINVSLERVLIHVFLVNYELPRAALACRSLKHEVTRFLSNLLLQARNKLRDLGLVANTRRERRVEDSALITTLASSNAECCQARVSAQPAREQPDQLSAHAFATLTC